MNKYNTALVDELIEAVRTLMYQVDGYEWNKDQVRCVLERLEYGRCECAEFCREGRCNA